MVMASALWHWTLLIKYYKDRRASTPERGVGGALQFELKERLNGRHGSKGTIESGGGRERAEGGRLVCMIFK